MLSRLAVGYGSWNGHAVPEERLHDGLDSGKHRHGVTVKPLASHRLSFDSDSNAVGEEPFPKTYLTRKGALILFSSRENHEGPKYDDGRLLTEAECFYHRRQTLDRAPHPSRFLNIQRKVVQEEHSHGAVGSAKTASLTTGISLKHPSGPDLEAYIAEVKSSIRRHHSSNAADANSRPSSQRYAAGQGEAECGIAEERPASGCNSSLAFSPTPVHQLMLLPASSLKTTAMSESWINYVMADSGSKRSKTSHAGRLRTCTKVTARPAASARSARLRELTAGLSPSLHRQGQARLRELTTGLSPNLHRQGPADVRGAQSEADRRRPIRRRTSRDDVAATPGSDTSGHPTRQEVLADAAAGEAGVDYESDSALFVEEDIVLPDDSESGATLLALDETETTLASERFFSEPPTRELSVGGPMDKRWPTAETSRAGVYFEESVATSDALLPPAAWPAPSPSWSKLPAPGFASDSVADLGKHLYIPTAQSAAHGSLALSGTSEDYEKGRSATPNQSSDKTCSDILGQQLIALRSDSAAILTTDTNARTLANGTGSSQLGHPAALHADASAGDSGLASSVEHSQYKSYATPVGTPTQQQSKQQSSPWHRRKALSPERISSPSAADGHRNWHDQSASGHLAVHRSDMLNVSSQRGLEKTGAPRKMRATVTPGGGPVVYKGDGVNDAAVKDLHSPAALGGSPRAGPQSPEHMLPSGGQPPKAANVSKYLALPETALVLSSSVTMTNLAASDRARVSSAVGGHQSATAAMMMMPPERLSPADRHASVQLPKGLPMSSATSPAHRSTADSLLKTADVSSYGQQMARGSVRAAQPDVLLSTQYKSCTGSSSSRADAEGSSMSKKTKKQAGSRKAEPSTAPLAADAAFDVLLGANSTEDDYVMPAFVSNLLSAPMIQLSDTVSAEELAVVEETLKLKLDEAAQQLAAESAGSAATLDRLTGARSVTKRKKSVPRASRSADPRCKTQLEDANIRRESIRRKAQKEKAERRAEQERLHAQVADVKERNGAALLTTEERLSRLREEEAAAVAAINALQTQEDEARRALAKAREASKGEREARRQNEDLPLRMMKTKQLVELLQMEQETRHKQLTLLESVVDPDAMSSLWEDEVRRQSEEEWREEQRQENEEQKAMLEAEEEEARIAEIEKKAEEEAMRHIVAERELADEALADVRSRLQQLISELEQQRKSMEAEEERLLEHIRAFQEEEKRKDEDDRHRALMTVKLERETRERLRQEAELRRNRVMALRNKNLDAKANLSSIRRNQGINKAWVFSYYVRWPRETQEKLIGSSEAGNVQQLSAQM